MVTSTTAQKGLTELKFELNLIKGIAQQALEGFLLIFSAINFTHHANTLLLTKKLTEFIAELCNDLQQQDIPINTQEVDTLQNLLLEHLHKDNRIQPTKLDKQAINYFISSLFNASHSLKYKTMNTADSDNSVQDEANLITVFLPNQFIGNNEALLKKQIAMLLSLTAKITQFPLKQLRDLCVLQDMSFTKS